MQHSHIVHENFSVKPVCHKTGPYYWIYAKHHRASPIRSINNKWEALKHALRNLEKF